MFKVVPSHIEHAEKVIQGWADLDLTSVPQSPEVWELNRSTSSPSLTTALRRTRPPEKLKDYVLLVR